MLLYHSLTILTISYIKILLLVVVLYVSVSVVYCVVSVLFGSSQYPSGEGWIDGRRSDASSLHRLAGLFGTIKWREGPRGYMEVITNVAPYYVRKKPIEIVLRASRNTARVTCLVIDNNGRNITNDEGYCTPKEIF